MADYYYVYRKIGFPSEKDIVIGQPVYHTYEAAAQNLDPMMRCLNEAIITRLNGRWYSVAKKDGRLIYWDLHSDLFTSWRTREEIKRGVDLNSIPFQDLAAMAAKTAYLNGTLAEALAIKQDDLCDYGFYDKFTEFFGKPMHEVGV